MRSLTASGSLKWTRRSFRVRLAKDHFWRRTDTVDTCLMLWRRWALHVDTYFFGISCHGRSALPLARYAPDHIANIVRHQNGAVRTECYADRSSIGLPFI